MTVHLQGAGLCYNRNRHCYHNDVHVSLLLNVTLSWAQRWTTRDLRVRLCLFSISQLCACCCFNRPTFRIAVCEYSFFFVVVVAISVVFNRYKRYTYSVEVGVLLFCFRTTRSIRIAFTAYIICIPMRIYVTDLQSIVRVHGFRTIRHMRRQWQSIGWFTSDHNIVRFSREEPFYIATLLRWYSNVLATTWFTITLACINEVRKLQFELFIFWFSLAITIIWLAFQI